MSVNNVRLQRSRLTTAMLAALLAPGAALAQDTQDTTSQQQSSQTQEQLDRVTVTGSRIKRATVEGPAPITVITADDLERQGFTTVSEALNTLTQISGSAQNELTQSGFTPNASALDLRGLGPGRVLTLINGRRVADYPLPYNGQSNFVNLNAIPRAAVERIEVLSGGASAIYGSDAVAGVVNIILKTNYEGDEVNIRAGTTTRGGSDSGDVTWVGGKSGDNWSVTYAAQYVAREGLFASQRDFMDSYRDDPSTANPTPVEGIRLRNRQASTNNRLWPGGRDAVCGRFAEFEAFTLPNNLGQGCGYWGYPATQAIRNDLQNASAYLYGVMDFSSALQGFATLSIWDSQAKTASSTQFFGSPIFYDPQFGRLVDAQRIFTPDEVGNQETSNDERSWDFAVGLRGTLFDGRFDWDATLSRSEYEVEVSRPRFLRQPLFDYFLGPQLGTISGFPIHQLNIDRYFRPLDQATYRTLSTDVVTTADSSVTQANFVFSGDLFELPAGPVAMAAVLEGGRQEYTLNPDPRLLPGTPPAQAIYNLTGTGGGGERDRYAAGVEFSVPILSTLKAQLAARYDKYDDVTAVDDAVTYNAGLEFRPTDSLLFRGSYATSFRAPDMHYVFADTSGFFVGVFDEYLCRQTGQTPQQCGNAAAYNYQVFGTRQGNPNLEEEEGKSWTAGVVWDVLDNLSMEVDYFNIELDNAVADIGTAYLLRNEAACRLGTDRDGTSVDPNSAGCQQFRSFVTRTVGGPNDGRIEEIRLNPINQSFNAIDGIDATVRYRLDTDRLGDFNFSLKWSHTLSQEFEEFPGDGVEDYRDDPTNFDFRSRVNWAVNWSRDTWAASIYGYRWGSVPNWEETGRIAPYIIWNGAVSKEITPKATIGVSVNNIFDKLAPRDDSFYTYPFFWRAYSPIGREVFVEFNYKFN
ncbi:TonB-dependent siderophore receptor [Lysobacter sp. N42]|uniref:TonB-dependent receptor plug domain-containing protein n=1 Tax=Lysobacter sp. N42 TaxID=2545719 RepID=UPI001046478A|nr:TonB-dependent receptor [Lysobacter sp. N42]TCZ87397.1 TonB-dependent receptor [Lysobacter sp. N42]